MSDAFYIDCPAYLIGPFAHYETAQKAAFARGRAVVSNARSVGKPVYAPGKEPTAPITENPLLTVPERADLERLEGIITQGKQTFVEVGNALMTIRERKLYREYGTFEMYCKRRWDFSRQHGYRLMAAAEIAINLSPTGDIPSERAARELTALEEPADQQDAALLAKAAADHAGVEPTALHYRAGVETVQEIKATGGYVTIDDTQVKADAPIPAAVAATVNTATEIMQRKTQHIQDNSQWERIDTLIACLGEVEAWAQAMTVRYGGELEIKIVLSRKKAGKPS